LRQKDRESEREEGREKKQPVQINIILLASYAAQTIDQAKCNGEGERANNIEEQPIICRHTDLAILSAAADSAMAPPNTAICLASGTVTGLQRIK